MNSVFEFVISIFQTRVGYSFIVKARSVFSSLTEPVNGLTLGKQPLLEGYMKEIFNIPPVLPKYTKTWHLDINLNCFGSLPDNIELTFKQLSEKLATLLCLL